MLVTERGSGLRQLRERGLSRSQLGYLLLTPAVILILATVVAPMLQTIALALQTVRLNRPDMAQGFNNFANFEYLVNDDNFWNGLTVTAIMVVTNVVGCLVLGTIVALVLNESFPGRGAVRGVILIPWAIPGVVVAMLWRFLYNSEYGVVQLFLVKVGLIDATQSMLGGRYALAAVLVAMIWRSTPFITMLILAGLQMIPGELYDAAKIDGANARQRLLHVTLPLVRSSLLIAVIFRSLDSFREFDMLYNLTQGGPGVDTQNLSLYTFKTYFAFMNFGYGATLALSMIAIAGIAVFFYVRTVGLQLSSHGRG